MEQKQAHYTKYSDFVILEEVQKFKKGEVKFKGQAFDNAANKLGLRPAQVSGRYYDLQGEGLTMNDLKDYTEQDKEEFYPGSGEPKVYSKKRSSTRNVGEEGYEKSYQEASDFEDLKKKHEGSEKIILTKNDDNSETVNFTKVRSLVKQLTKNLPLNTRLDIMSDLAEDI